MRKTPAQFFGSIYSSTGTTMSINKAGTPMEHYAGISPDGGDSFIVAYILLEILYYKYAAIPPAEKPTNWSVTKPNIQGTNTNEGRQQYIVNFSLELPPHQLGVVNDTQGI